MKPLAYCERDAGAGASTSPRYTRREWIGLTALASAGLSQTRQRPNILYIMADDHAAHAISAYGSTINRTPNIDRIAETGVRLTNCFCTNSICTPSRASILTVQYSHKNGRTGKEAERSRRSAGLGPCLTRRAARRPRQVEQYAVADNFRGEDKGSLGIEDSGLIALPDDQTGLI